MTVHPMVAAFRAAGVTAANIIVAKILKKQADTEVVHSWPKVPAPTAQAVVPRRGRGSSSNGVGAHGGARPLQDGERLEHDGFTARGVFGAHIVEYDENGLDYAARLSKPAFFEGYTAIPVGNAPWSVCRRWAIGVLKGGASTGG